MSLQSKVFVLIVAVVTSCGKKNDPAPIPNRSGFLIGTWEEAWQWYGYASAWPCNGRGEKRSISMDYGSSYPCCQVLDITPTTFTRTIADVTMSFTYTINNQMEYSTIILSNGESIDFNIYASKQLNFDISPNGSKRVFDRTLSANITCKEFLQVTTAAITDITSTTAIGGGTVLSQYESPVVKRGLMLQKNGPDFPIYTSDGTGLGSFSSLLTGLSPDTWYIVHAYANTGYANYYGNYVSFKTPP